MKLELLIHSLESLQASAENHEYERDIVMLMLLKDLLEYIDNPKVSDAVNEIVF